LLQQDSLNTFIVYTNIQRQIYTKILIMNTFIDLEWSHRGHIFLLGYARNTRDYGFLYGSRLNQNEIFDILAGSSFVYVWGPDIGRIEKYYNMDVRNRFRCVNLLTVAKDYIKSPNYRLDTIEKKLRIPREVNLKEQRGDIYQLWKKDPELVKAYNKNDVISLYYIERILRYKYGLTAYDFRKYEMT